ncbi:hypothetical protein BSF33_13665, partial [Staphylococcus ureilyticus]
LPGGRRVDGGHGIAVDVMLVDPAPGERQCHAEDSEQAGDCHPPDVPYHAESEADREEGDEEASAGAYRHLDGGRRRHLGPAQRRQTGALGSPEGVEAIHLHRRREVEGRRRRRRGPLQRTSIPWVAAQVAPVRAATDADDQLHDRA